MATATTPTVFYRSDPLLCIEDWLECNQHHCVVVHVEEKRIPRNVVLHLCFPTQDSETKQYSYDRHPPVETMKVIHIDYGKKANKFYKLMQALNSSQVICGCPLKNRAAKLDRALVQITISPNVFDS